MSKRLWGRMIVAVVLASAVAESTRAEDIVFQDLSASLAATGVVRQKRFVETGSSLPSPANHGRLDESGRPPASAWRPSQDQTLPFRTSNQADWTTGAPPAASWGRPQPTNSSARPLSSRGSFAGTASKLSGRPGDGSRAEGNRYGMDSQQGRQWKYVEKPPVGRGTVYGRLTNQGRPLLNCRVTIVPMKKEGKDYRVDEASQPLTLTTDDRGVYYFENVPAGAYKLTWLPHGTNQWIRRISVQPDVMVRADKAVGLKEIRIALQTIN